VAAPGAADPRRAGRGDGDRGRHRGSRRGRAGHRVGRGSRPVVCSGAAVVRRGPDRPGPPPASGRGGHHPAAADAGVRVRGSREDPGPRRPATAASRPDTGRRTGRSRTGLQISAPVRPLGRRTRLPTPPYRSAPMLTDVSLGPRSGSPDGRPRIACHGRLHPPACGARHATRGERRDAGATGAQPRRGRRAQDRRAARKAARAAGSPASSPWRAGAATAPSRSPSMSSPFAVRTARGTATAPRRAG
jgi:hypothetical protein